MRQSKELERFRREISIRIGDSVSSVGEFELRHRALIPPAYR